MKITTFCVIYFITDGKWNMALLDADLSYWGENVSGVNVLDANIKLIILLTSVVIGVLLIVMGMIKAYRMRKDEKD